MLSHEKSIIRMMFFLFKSLEMVLPVAIGYMNYITLYNHSQKGLISEAMSGDSHHFQSISG